MKTADLQAWTVDILRHHNTISFSRGITSGSQMAAIARALDLDCVYWLISGQFEMRKHIDIDPKSKTSVRVWSRDWVVV